MHQSLITAVWRVITRPVIRDHLADHDHGSLSGYPGSRCRAATCPAQPRRAPATLHAPAPRRALAPGVAPSHPVQALAAPFPRTATIRRGGTLRRSSGAVWGA